MRSLLNLMLGCCLFTLVACSSTDTTSTASPGAVGSNCAATCCPEKAAAPGAVSDKSSCCPMSGQKATEASPGAMGDGCATKSSCTKVCPATATVSPGAVSESGCSKPCSSKTAEVSPGAVSGKSGCCKSKSSCTKSE